MPPPPAKWKGHCDFNKTVCNNKLIGAKTLRKGIEHGHRPPIDPSGHGTHVASIAAGAFVKDAVAFGNSFGRASGMAPRAHIALYQVCGLDDCTGVDLLKGIEAAVHDGVDILSISMGEEKIQNPMIGQRPQKTGPLGVGINPEIIIGAFYAISHGVLVSAAAGNDGPAPGSVVNDAPWMLTVGASTTDRRMASVVANMVHHQN
ncbi:hypothetical protein LUZ60_016817 [Juncus effusus]|nr:hypothetical protein LUZ60_016817 [Juncus effusus]